MANKNQIYYETQNSESWEKLFPDEWTMIDDDCSEKDDNEEDANNADDTQEISRQGIEVLQVPVDDAIDDGTENAIIGKQGEDSDGISVITESDAEQSVERKNFQGTGSCRDHLCTTLNEYENFGEKSATQVGTILNVVIACSLAAIIGLGAGRILGMDDKCPLTNSIDFPTIKMESDMLVNQIRELGEVKNVLDEIKASIPTMKEAQQKITDQGSKSKSKRAERNKKSLKMSETYTFHPDNTILEQLRTSLNTLCSVIDEINPENEILRSDSSRTREIVMDLMKFKGIVDTVMKELEDTSKEKELEFFRNAEKKIREICKSLLDDLTRTIHGLTTKMHKKLNKVRQKLNKRLCLLKISEPINKKLFEPLEENNSFLEGCDKLLNVALKPQTVKINKKKMSNKKIHPKKTSLNNSSVIRSSESDDNYSRYSSSDSSMPELTYNRDDNNDFSKEKCNSRRKEKNTKHKSGKSPLIEENKGGGSRKGRNLIVDVIEAKETSPVTEEPSFEFRTSKEKVLYSTVVKSISKDTESKRDNLKKRKPKGKVNLEGKQTLTETKHNVTPAESDINVPQKDKNTKKQWNANIREPIVEYYDVPRHETIPQHKEILSERNEDLQQPRNIEKISSLTPPPKSGMKNKKCYNNSNASNDSKKKEGSTTDYVDKRDRISDEKCRKISTHQDDKKSKTEKLGRKRSSLPKMTAPKIERDSTNRNDKRKTNDQLMGDWQLQRSRAREMHRHHDHRSEWFFDRADYRQDARQIVNRAQGPEYCWKGKCLPILEEEMHDEEYSDDWFELKRMKARRHSGGRAGFTAKKLTKMPHRRNIIQSKRH